MAKKSAAKRVKKQTKAAGKRVSQSQSIKCGKYRIITISRKKYPESAKHIEDAQKDGKPSILTIDRDGAKKNRKESLRGISTEKGKDRDEYPFAMCKEGGRGASVRLINLSDNRGAGASMGNQCRKPPPPGGLPNGAKIKIIVVD